MLFIMTQIVLQADERTFIWKLIICGATRNRTQLLWVLCFRRHRYNLSQYTREIFNWSRLREYTRDRKIYLVAFRRTKTILRHRQCSQVLGGRLRALRDIPSPVIISSRLPLFGFYVPMGFSRNHRCGIGDNSGSECLRIRTITIVTYSRKLIFSFRNSPACVFSPVF